MSSLILKTNEKLERYACPNRVHIQCPSTSIDDIAYSLLHASDLGWKFTKDKRWSKHVSLMPVDFFFLIL